MDSETKGLKDFMEQIFEVINQQRIEVPQPQNWAENLTKIQVWNDAIDNVVKKVEEKFLS